MGGGHPLATFYVLEKEVEWQGFRLLSLSVEAKVAAQMVLCPEEQFGLGVGCADRIVQGRGGGQGAADPLAPRAFAVLLLHLFAPLVSVI